MATVGLALNQHHIDDKGENMQHRLNRSASLCLVIGASFSLDCWAAPETAPPPSARVKRGHLFANPAQLWPDNTVYYSLTNASVSARRSFLQAIRHIAANSALRFIEHTDQPHFIYITSSNIHYECHSDISNKTGPQQVAIGPWCQDLHSALHETMHALGFDHEHQRPDRDQFIRVSKPELNDPTMIKKRNTRMLGNYDLDSVMHYDSAAWSGTSFEPKDPAKTIPPASQRQQLSPGDITALREAYPPKNILARSPEPGDNGLSVILSAKRLWLTPGETRKISIQALSPEIIRSTRLWSEFPEIASLTLLKNQPGNRFSLQVTAGNQGSGRQYFSFTTGSGKTGTAVFHTHVASKKSQPDTGGQLKPVNHPYCLAAAPAEAYGPGGRNQRYSLAWQIRQPPSIYKLGLIPCDGEDPTQFWEHKASGQLSVLGHCLDLDMAGRLSMPPCRRTAATKRQTLPSQRWLRVKKQWIHEASQQRLHLLRGGIPGTAPAGSFATAAEQQWEWQ